MNLMLMTYFLIIYLILVIDEIVILIHDIIIYSTSICPFEFGKYGKKTNKLQKFDYLENENSFLDEIKSIFYSFGRAITW